MLLRTGLYIVASLSSALAQTNLVENPGFETGTLSPWTTAGSAEVATASQEDSIDYFPHSGEYFAQLADGEAEINPPTSISQVVSGLGIAGGSVPLTGNYILSYYYAVFDEPDSTCFLSASLAGDPISSTALYDYDQGSGYQLVNTTFYFPPDGTQEAVLEISVDCDEEGITVIGLDDISLVYA